MAAVVQQTYVLDTTILIDNPEIIYDLSEADIIIPLTVIRQLDGLKNNADHSLAKKARTASRILDELTATGDSIVGIPLKNRSLLKLSKQYDSLDVLDNVADNKIIGTATKLKGVTKNIALLTTDRNMKISARAYGINAPQCMTYKIKRAVVSYEKGTHLTLRIILFVLSVFLIFAFTGRQ